jgi:transposase
MKAKGPGANMSNSDLTEVEWRTLGASLHIVQRSESGKGRAPRLNRKTINGILWRLRTGAAWQDMPARYGKWNSVYQGWKRWNARGTLVNVNAALAKSRGYTINLTTIVRARYRPRKGRGIR